MKIQRENECIAASPDESGILDHGPRGLRLNLGCGRRKMEDAVNLDVTPATNPDVLWDLSNWPWPFENESICEIFAFDVIEHLDDFLGTMEEIHRICAPGARIHISVPHFSSRNAFTDPTHRRFFGVASMNYLSADSELGFYTEARFRIIRSQILFDPSVLSRIVWRLANRFPELYERRFAWIYPAWFLSFELEVVK